MIVKMKKITFLGLALEKERFLARLQEVGAVHLILPRDMVEAGEIARELVKVVDARKFLARQKPSPSVAAAMDWETICARREELAQQEQRLAIEIASLKKDRNIILPFGDFRMDDIAFLEKKGLITRFYRTPRSIYERLDFGEIRHFVLNETTGEVAFVAMSLREDRLPLVEEKLPGRTLGQIEEAIAQREADLAKIQAEYTEMAAQITTLTAAENKLTDDLALGRAILNTQGELDERLFVLTVWTPVKEDDLMRCIGSDYTILSIAEEPDPSEQIPVLLRNQAPADAGEDLVKIYSFPNHKDFDPSAIVLYCFVIFYGMIIGDAGYGLLFLLLSIYLHRKIKSQSPLWIRMRRMSYMLAGSVTFFGLITASYFGINLADGHIAKKIMLMDFSTPAGQNFAMKVSIIMGIAHLSIAMAIKFYRTRDWPSVGWILVGWAGFFLINSKMGKGVDNPVAMWIMIAGFVLVALFTSSNKNPIIRLLAGLNGCLGVMQLFADVLSYMRLFALGLATMYMCQTFNMLGDLTRQSVPYVGIVLAIPVLVFGHGLNMVLGVMGGVVHGLRLNFLEWYRWCFEGDGLAFKPFQRIGK